MWVMDTRDLTIYLKGQIFQSRCWQGDERSRGEVRRSAVAGQVRKDVGDAKELFAPKRLGVSNTIKLRLRLYCS